MALNVAETRQRFPFPPDKVFDAVAAILGPAGYTVKSQDRLIGRITASAPMSGFSWGEDIVLQIQGMPDNSTELGIQSNLKVGINVAATSKNAANAERIIGATSHYLQHGRGDASAAVAAAPDASSPAVMWIMAIVVTIIMLGFMLGM